MTKKSFELDRHKRVLTEILIDIIKQLNGKVVFKGGTAAMMFYNLSRMSLDLDFDLLEELSVQVKITSTISSHIHAILV